MSWGTYRKQMARLWMLLGFAPLIYFQNCTPLQPSMAKSSTMSSASASSSSSSHTPLSSQSGGQPYDGKPYIVSSLCDDGTSVQSRILLTKNKAMLYRDACKTGQPLQIQNQALDLSALDSGRIGYNNQVYFEEKPAIPLPGLVSWFMQLTGPLTSQPAGIYIIDLFDNDASTIQDLKVEGHTVICSISAGIRENWNPDAGYFQPTDIGRTVSGGSGERWLDIRSASVRSVMLARLDMAKSKGCQGVDFDNVDGFENNTGFGLTRTNQIEYNRFLAFAAHDRNLILTLNGVASLAEDLAPVFELAIEEQCFEYNECDSYSAFIRRGKPVLAIEYGPISADECQRASQLQLSLAYFNQELDGSRYETCH
jgi:hypothetical protein